MGRELMRVPIDFTWTLNFIWKGYWTPYTSQECPACKGTGQGPLYKALSDAWYKHTSPPKDPEARKIYDENAHWMEHLEQDEVDHLCDKNRLSSFCEEWRVPTEEEWAEMERERKAAVRRDWRRYPWAMFKPWFREKILRREPEDTWQTDPTRPRWIRKLNEDGTPYYPPAEFVNENAPRMMLGGHDSINQWICTDLRAKKLGIEEKRWGCAFCDDGRVWFSEKIRKRADRWYDKERYGPPKGEGYQLWETVSEGSPVSPVFATGEEMVIYLVDECGFDPEASKRFVKETGWAPSMTMHIKPDGTKDLRSNIDALKKEA